MSRIGNVRNIPLILNGSTNCIEVFCIKHGLHLLNYTGGQVRVIIDVHSSGPLDRLFNFKTAYLLRGKKD